MIGVFGGTFNPIHFGHLRPALEIAEALKLEQLRFIPCGSPPHRQEPGIDARQRVQMVAAAVAGEPRFIVDDRELQREGLSYSFDTLTSLRAELGQVPIVLAIGMDAFSYFHTWHRWQELADLAHIAVMHRPAGGLSQASYKQQLPDVIKHFVQSRLSSELRELQQASGGKVWIEEVSQLDISATKIRQMLKDGKSIRYLTPDAVLEIIEQQQLYK